MTLHHIAAACGGCLHNIKEDREVSGVVLDSRQVEEGTLFLAVKGERVDGHSFISQVFARGAAGVVCEKEPEEAAGPYILVRDSLQALKDIAEYYRSQLTIPIIGITGSVGKTSTKEAVAAVLSQKYRVWKTEGNFNNEIGLPLMILKIRPEHEVAVMEMGISDFGEMHRLSKIARPDLCVLTNIGQCHLENLGSREGILKAKTEIFDFMQEDGVVCLNGDDDMLAAITEVKGKQPLRFGLGQDNDVYAAEVENKGLWGSRVGIRMDGETFSAEVPLPGEHMVVNALAAACIGRQMGMSKEEIVKGIAAMEAVGGRSHVIRCRDWVIIDDCYNANPVSMGAALDLLAEAEGRTVAVLGDMFELGDREKELHAEVGADAVAKGTDLVICIGTLSREMYHGACRQAEALGLDREHICYFADRDSFLEQSGKLLQPGDTILIKASHGMAFERLVQALED